MSSFSVRRLVLAVALAAASSVAWAGDLSFTCTTDKPAIGYRPSERMVFSIQLLDDAKPVAGRKLTWTRRGDDKKTDQGEATSSDKEPLKIETSCDQPGFVNIEVHVIGEDGKRVKDARNQEVLGSFGAGVEPEKLTGAPEPADFDAFWAKQKSKLKEVPIKAELVPVAGNPKFDIYDVKIDCPGGKPVSGYLTKPKGAAAKSLQAKVGFMGYGVYSAGQECREGMVILNINAHGIENGRDKAFYEQLQNGALKGYAFDKTQNSDPETAYFNGMMLRVLRALEYVKSLPEWNGNDLIADGGSQGGLQCLTAAGLDPDVTRCTAWKPWCCDLGGLTLGRVEGWRPSWTPALAYYDPINHAKRIRCETTIITGLGDYVCPPSGNSVLYNNIKAPKSIEYIQGATHGFDPKDAERFKLTTK
jgi:cephalosporin-C deacetylase-like acetyl esterase